nr:MAG TPA: hypothetical protein [Caudoviricetes sp.]
MLFCIIESFLKIKAVCKAERYTAEINQYAPRVTLIL